MHTPFQLESNCFILMHTYAFMHFYCKSQIQGAQCIRQKLYSGVSLKCIYAWGGKKLNGVGIVDRKFLNRCTPVSQCTHCQEKSMLRKVQRYTHLIIAIFIILHVEVEIPIQFDKCRCVIFGTRELTRHIVNDDCSSKVVRVVDFVWLFKRKIPVIMHAMVTYSNLFSIVLKQRPWPQYYCNYPNTGLITYRTCKKIGHPVFLEYLEE